jgi:hypothetical protein
MDYDTDIKQFINNKEYSDFKIINDERIFYCHTRLFFTRISCTDLSKSPDLSCIFTETRTILDFSKYHINNETILALIELLYLGYFESYITYNTLYELIKLTMKLHLRDIKVQIMNFVKYSFFFNTPISYEVSLIELEKFKNNKKLINCSNQFFILRLENNKDIYINNLLKNRFNFYNEKSLVKYHSSVFANYSENIRDLQDITSKRVFDETLLYTINRENLISVDKSILIEMLFFADYLCYESLQNVIIINLGIT